MSNVSLALLTAREQQHPVLARLAALIGGMAPPCMPRRSDAPSLSGQSDGKQS